jgi:hypothetical protein
MAALLLYTQNTPQKIILNPPLFISIPIVAIDRPIFIRAVEATASNTSGSSSIGQGRRWHRRKSTALIASSMFQIDSSDNDGIGNIMV